MNDTITKLWEDAAQRDDIWEQARYEKFAELIVKEMLVTCEKHPAWTGRMISEQIKEHFGVKE